MSATQILDRYCVFGNPIAQSKSPEIHRLFAEQTGEALSYDKQLVAEDAFESSVNDFFSSGGKGLNITVPFKLRAFDMAQQLTERARNAGAVNTLKILDNGELLGDNTDGQGMVSDMLERLGWVLAGKRILVLGAGGAVRGVLQPLLEQQPKQVVIANRTFSKAQQLAEAFAHYGHTSACEFSQLTGQQFDVVINGTSASLSGDLPPLPSNLLSAQSCCYDMMYSAQPTVFLRWADQQGAAHCADGLGMLVGQAAEAFCVWRGVMPQTQPVVESLRLSLSGS